jgi:hypothetical protein
VSVLGGEGPGGGGGGGLSKIEFAGGGMTHIAACEEVDAEMAGSSKEKDKKGVEQECSSGTFVVERFRNTVGVRGLYSRSYTYVYDVCIRHEILMLYKKYIMFEYCGC